MLENKAVWWSIQGPVVLTIIVSMLSIRSLFSKLRSWPLH